MEQQIQKVQNDVHTLLTLLPMGTRGRTGVLLAWEALRLAWYMLRGDRVGIGEKRGYVQSAYDALMEELA